MKHPNHPLDDEALALEIENALNVDPSPEFLARVRARIATADGRHRPWLTWERALMGTAAAASVAALIINAIARPVPPPLPAPPVPQAARALAPPEIAADAFSAPVTPQRAVAARVGRQAGEVALGSVMIPVQEQAALQMLMASVRSGYSYPPAPSNDTAAPEQIEPVAIQPLTIEPLPQLALLEGGPQW